MSEDFDIVVSGAGMVGSAAALGLAQQGARVALLEPACLAEVPSADDVFDLRVSAISPQSEKLLDRLGVWSQLPESRTCAYEKMFIWHEGGQANVSMDSSDIGHSHLGTIVENRQLVALLQQACLRTHNIRVYKNDQIETLDQSAKGAIEVQLGSGLKLKASLLLIAEGRQSPSRDLAGFKIQTNQYNQSAIVTNICTQRAHQFTAWQRFLTTGPLALLPLGNGQTSIVWSADQPVADELLDLDDEGFCERLTEASESKLGVVTSMGRRASFPLVSHSCEHWINGRVVLIGDAAHGVHPLAGQGVNLGFGDIELLLDCIPEPKYLGKQSLLRRYERQRKSETVIAMHSFSALKWLYANQSSVQSGLRNFGMDQLQKSSLVKRFLMQKALQNMV
ncbi:MAG: 2-octaprenylphenol hydroxylase [Gammaproteobacteria bacterium]